MSAESKQLNPSDLTDDQLDRIAFAILGKLSKFQVQEKPMRVKEAAAFLGISQKHFYHLVNQGKIKLHRLEDKGRPYAYASEINGAVRKKAS